jgi:chloramphenicol O-acetyltransferase type A
MHEIQLDTWPRTKHFEFFSRFDHPHFSMSVNLDLTTFHQHIKRSGTPFTPAWVYVITRAANAVPEFRQRIRSPKVVEHDTVSASLTILLDNGLFGFCAIPYSDDFNEFLRKASTLIADAREHPTLTDEQDRDDLLFMTAIPWVSFTSFSHPMQLHPADSIPRFAWGKFFPEGRALKIPLSVQGHHALMDGLHMAKFYETVERYLADPSTLV